MLYTSSIRPFLASLGHARRGLISVWKGERNFRIQTGCAVLVLGCAALLRYTFEEMLFLFIACAAVLASEMINTIVEELLDIIEPRFSAHVGRLKDVTAGLVLLLSLCAVVIGILTTAHHFAIVETSF